LDNPANCRANTCTIQSVSDPLSTYSARRENQGKGLHLSIPTTSQFSQWRWHLQRPARDAARTLFARTVRGEAEQVKHHRSRGWGGPTTNKLGAHRDKPAATKTKEEAKSQQPLVKALVEARAGITPGVHTNLREQGHATRERGMLPTGKWARGMRFPSENT